MNIEPGFKACPFCAEPIREAAIVCRFCNRSLTAQNGPRDNSALTTVGIAVTVVVITAAIAVPYLAELSRARLHPVTPLSAVGSPVSATPNVQPANASAAGSAATVSQGVPNHTYTFTALPVCGLSNRSQRAFISDSPSQQFGEVVVDGGGSYQTWLKCDGLAWKVSNMEDSPQQPSQTRTNADTQWRSLGRVTFIDTTVSVASSQGWTVKETPDKAIPPLQCVSTRWTMGGEFASNDPVVFVVLDPENYQRFQIGEPPIIQYARTQGQEISLPQPAPGSWYGFVRPKPRLDGTMPHNLTELGLALVTRAIQENRPPAQVTVKLWVDAECFCTAADAARLQIH